MASIDEERVARVMERLGRMDPEARLLVNDPWAIYWLTGFYAEMYERFSGLLLSPGERPVLFNNELYPIEDYDNAEVVIYKDTDDVAEILARRLDPARPLGVDAKMRSQWKSLLKSLQLILQL